MSDTQTTISPRQQFLNDVLITAVEGGINYWAAVSEYRWSDGNGNDLPVASVTVHEFDDFTGDYGEGVKITATDLSSAIAKILHPASTISLADDYVARIFLASRTNDAGEIDASDADCILQVALLGEVVYG